MKKIYKLIGVAFLFFLTSCKETSSSISVTPTTETTSIGHVHQYGELIPEVKPTCTETGTAAHYECSVCHKKFIAEGNSFIEKTDEELIENALGHDYGSLIRGTDADCANYGSKDHYECQRCHKLFVKDGDIYHEVTENELRIAPKGHIYGDLIEEKASTCLKQGRKAHYECEVCGKYFVDDGDKKKEVNYDDLVLPLADHQYGELIPEVASTCTKAGTAAHYECSVCHKLFTKKGDSYTEATYDSLTLPTLDHQYSYSNRKAFTHEKECSVGGEKTTENHVFDANGLCACGMKKTTYTDKYVYVDLSTDEVKPDALDITNSSLTYYDDKGNEITFNKDTKTGEQKVIAYDGNKNLYEVTALVCTKVISSQEDFKVMQWDGTTAVSGYFALRKNLYFDGNAMSDEKYEFQADKGFTGTFHGAGHSIEHAVVSLGGLFGTLGGAVIRDIEFKNYLISGSWGQCLLAHTSYWTHLINVKISVSDNWTSPRDAYGQLFAFKAENLYLENVQMDFLSDVAGFSDEKMKFGYAIAQTGTFRSVKNTTIYTTSTNILGNNDKETLLANWPSLSILDTLPASKN